MKFSLIDRIDELEPGKRIRGSKVLAMAEEYLRDHFPKFPVMPGVLMIEAMTQASAWLVRVSEDFAHSMVLLKEVKHVKFGKFLQPGQTLVVTATMVSETEHEVVLKTEGTIDGETRIRAQLTMARYNLGDLSESQAVFDSKLIERLREELALIWDQYIPERDQKTN
ncbi:MAG: 3-hydroxyacyl-ACP dehydratase FabZ family protein [Planctomycetia bacterium]|nr:3-hydroxyacyl-ACP dehydratase FabZ family protein [Planctomycetia bacterium]